MEPTRIKNILESLLLVARKPLSLEEIEKTTSLPAEILSPCLEELINEYQSRGIRLIKVAGGYLMGTNPDNIEFIEKILHAKIETTLSPQALETLAIIAYKQPVTRVEIERLRGVISDGVIETLLAKKLIREVGRSDAVGRPYLYSTTVDFLRHFGLKDLSGLPPLPESVSEQENIFRSALQESQP
jgi:segregation and condensation protein B